MKYICKTQRKGDEGLCHCYPKADRASNPISFYPEERETSDCPLFSLDNLFRIRKWKWETFLGIKKHI